MVDRQELDDDPRQLPPSDTERLTVLSRLIHERISELATLKSQTSFTPDLARELHVLEQLRDTWLLEGHK